MSKSSGHFDGFGPHSRYKHLILRKYFEAWGRILLLGDPRRTRVLYVDACAGRGADKDGVQGSPVIAAVAAADAAGQLATMPGGAGKHVIVLAIEKIPKHHRALQDNLADFAPDARALLGTLGDHLPAIEQEFGETPALFFIDPFGVEPLRADAVGRALRGPKNEVLLLFNDQAAVRHFGVATATETVPMRRLRQRRAMPSLFDDHDVADLARLTPEAERSSAALGFTQPRSTEILDAAFGPLDWRAAVSGVPKEGRRDRLLSLYKELLASFGAAYVLAFPVYKEDGTYAYTLIHASRNVRARREMQDAVSYALKHGTFLPNEVREAMREDMCADLGSVVRLITTRWAGQEVRWVDEAGACLKYDVLDNTDVWPFQLAELRQILRPYKKPGRGPETYDFPKRPDL